MDPHDQMMLANRPTTVVTQGTTLLDQMPTPFGDQGDEESMFAGIGADDTEPRLRGRRSVEHVHGRRRGQDVLADDAVPASGKTIAIIAVSVLGLSMLGFFSTKRR